MTFKRSKNEKKSILPRNDGIQFYKGVTMLGNIHKSNIFFYFMLYLRITF